MIEKIILDYLNDHMDVPAYMEEPIEKPSQYFIIEKTSGGMTTYISNATIAIQSYADSLYEAASLNEELKKIMFSIIELNVICDCQLNSDYNFTDTTKKKYRYQAIFDITYYDE